MARPGNADRLATSSSSLSHQFCRHPHYPVLHSLQVIFSFFSLLGIVLFCCPLPSTAHLFPSTCLWVPGYTYSPLYQPVPNSTVCSSLDWLPVSFLSDHSITLSGLKPRRHSCLFYSFLLLLSGDIQVNPGPVASFPSINLVPILTLVLFPPSPLNLINLPPFLTSSLAKMLTFLLFLRLGSPQIPHSLL